jgi:hypothetical protein
VPIEFIFSTAQIICVRNIEYLPALSATSDEHDIFVDKLAQRYELGALTSKGLTDWATMKDGELCMAYPSEQDWGAVFITYGKFQPQPRPGEDLSAYHTLSFEMKGQKGSETLFVGIKDNVHEDDGTEPQANIENLSTKWQTYSYDLSNFAPTNLHKLYIPVEFLFFDAATVCVRNIQYLK